MGETISIHGRAFNRAIAYIDNGIHNEFVSPGGAAIVAKILHGKGISGNVTLDGSFLTEHLGLTNVGGSSPNGRYRVGAYFGITPGSSRIDTAPAPRALLWGDKFEDLPVPGDTPVLWASNEGLPPKRLFEMVADRCFLMLDADVLRSAGALVSRQISWERSATELIWQLRNNPLISYLSLASRVLVTFAEDGAVSIRRRDGHLSASLTLTHGGGEGILREQAGARLYEAFAVMASAAATQFADSLFWDKESQILPILKSAESLMLSGYSIERLKNADFEIFGPEGSSEVTPYPIPIKPIQEAIVPDDWCITNSVSNKRVFDIAYDYVLEGPKVIEGMPQLSFGALTTVDRWEIEAFQNIRNLIVGYARDASVRPLSIAAFGSPGSGKSFGVTQIAKNVLPGKVEKLEFNVSQFTGLSDLSAAFHKVRDVILEGKLPLVFFDEFDSDRDGSPLGWLKSFLMPMQDGKFKDESGEHPLGKCVLAFAGGTASSLDEFTRPTRSEDPLERKKFKNVKGPDFVSRLRGWINVLGPNQKDENDKNYILRRALLLRSLCERKLGVRKGQAPINPNIVWAMLLAPSYKHGARSMEAILDMSQIDGSVWEPVSLPFHSLLSLHVDADAFLRLVLRETILNSYVEQLATAIHADYLDKMRAAGNDGHPNVVDWGDLTEDLRESNRSQARSFAEKLNMIGYAYDSGDTPFPSVERFDEATTLLLAQAEHIRWMNDRLANGWTFAPVRDDAKKQHHLLVPWDSLPDEEKKKDVNVADNIIPLLKIAGLRVYQTI
jgi:hypothetical protein